MEEYYFLFIIAGAWTLIASLFDFKITEVPNWLNFSFIAVALSYRLFYSIILEDFEFFVFGLIGLVIFIGLGYAFYYGKAFGGGDAKLLFGIGVILPYSNYFDFIYFSIAFVLLLFGIGAIWTFFYSLFLLNGRIKEVRKEFETINKWKKIFASIVFLLGLILALNFEGYLTVSFLLFAIAPLFYFYAKIVDSVCLIREVNPKDLREGDWIYKDIKIKGRIIKKSVHGLNKEEILFLKKNREKVVIRAGIPFTISFFLAMVSFSVLFLTGALFFSF